jgi:hypothetical protein
LPGQRKDVIQVAKLLMLLVANAETNRRTRNVMIMKYLVKLNANPLSFAEARVSRPVDFHLPKRQTFASVEASDNVATDKNP